MAGRMARAVAHGQRFPAYLHAVAIMQPARGREALRGRKAEHRALLGQAVDPELIAFMRADDGQGMRLRKLARAARMVDMRMREPDRAQRQAQALDFGQDDGQVAARVDDGRVAAFAAPDQRAVLLEGGDGNGEVFKHGV